MAHWTKRKDGSRRPSRGIGAVGSITRCGIGARSPGISVVRGIGGIWRFGGVIPKVRASFVERSGRGDATNRVLGHAVRSRRGIRMGCQTIERMSPDFTHAELTLCVTVRPHRGRSKRDRIPVTIGVIRQKIKPNFVTRYFIRFGKKCDRVCVIYLPN